MCDAECSDASAGCCSAGGVGGAVKPPPSSHLEYMINGVKVLFPIKPYSPQMGVMAQVVKGLKDSSNCLLESPTGTGKTLALLCSTLSWQQDYNGRVERYNNLIDAGVRDIETLEKESGLKSSSTPKFPTTLSEERVRPFVNSSFREEDDEEFLLTDVKREGETSSTQNLLEGSSNGAGAVKEPNDGEPLTGGGFVTDTDNDDFKTVPSNHKDPMEALVRNPIQITLEDSMADTRMEQRPKYKKAVKIYFGTRTHKQIAQVVKELKRTAFSAVNTTVLGSRDHYCIHPVVGKKPNKNDGCQQLRDPKTAGSCKFHTNAGAIKNHFHLTSRTGLSGAFDIEELVTAGKSCQTCPYYITRTIKNSADIIFCPYNYLVDPLIRDAMQISLSGHVIVLDEAHNIEDTARDAASGLFELEQFIEAQKDLERIKRDGAPELLCKITILFLTILQGWLESSARGLQNSYDSDKSSTIFTGQQIIDAFDKMDIGKNKWPQFKACVAELTQEDEEVTLPKLKSSTLTLLKNMFLMYHYLYTRPLEKADDYRVIVAKTFKPNKADTDITETTNVWLKKSRGGGSSWSTTMNFVCLNPGVAFKEVGDKARSVVLTSGTLSPMTSFQSELGIEFPIKFEGNHVIKGDQVFVRTIASGPAGVKLLVNHRNKQCSNFQDEIGDMLLSVCQTVPRGVLCFLPSYAFLETLKMRWQQTGLWDTLSEHKDMYDEPRRADQFLPTIQSFYNSINNTRFSPEGAVDGACLLAVCRGKVSEGIDFTDDNARAVVAVGIPYPNFKDPVIVLKKQYNDKYKHRGLLSGNEWYELQAFRAFNQALGRCIRHRLDWGAILLVDERFQRQEWLCGRQVDNKHMSKLSKWVRRIAMHRPTFRDSMRELKQFAVKLTSEPPKNDDGTAYVMKMIEIEEKKEPIKIAPIFDKPPRARRKRRRTKEIPVDIEELDFNPSELITSTQVSSTSVSLFNSNETDLEITVNRLECSRRDEITDSNNIFPIDGATQADVSEPETYDKFNEGGSATPISSLTAGMAKSRLQTPLFSNTSKRRLTSPDEGVQSAKKKDRHEKENDEVKFITSVEKKEVDEEDSDMDDFDLNKSVRRSPVIQRKTKSYSRPKGVQYVDLSD